MRLSVGADERNAVVEAVIKYLKHDGHRVVFYGPSGRSNVPWSEVAACVAHDIAGGAADEGILFCWTGTGVSIAANKVTGIRAALCGDAETARGARMWNDANLLCLSLRTTTEALAKEILKAWFTTQYQSTPEDDACLPCYAGWNMKPATRMRMPNLVVRGKVPHKKPNPFPIIRRPRNECMESPADGWAGRKRASNFARLSRIGR